MKSDKKKNVSGMPYKVTKEMANFPQELTYEKVFQGKKIGFSISNSTDMEALGFSTSHLQDVMIELARYFLVYGATLVYGGDLRKDGFTYVFSELARWYSRQFDEEPMRIENYFAWPVHLKLTKNQEREWKNYRLKLQKLEAVKVKTGKKIENDKFFSPNTTEHRYIWSKNLTHMREKITDSCDARILIGGQSVGYLGRMPGLLEEAILAIRSKKPLYLIGAFGGVTNQIIAALQGKKTEALEEDYQLNHSKNKEREYEALTEYIKQHDPEYAADYKALISELSKFGLKGLSANNGLSKEDNQRLFTTPHVWEMINLVLKGTKKSLR